jgi:hypothetical protein
VEEYAHSRFYYKAAENFDYNKTFEYSTDFISSVDVDDSLKLLVEGGSDKIASIYQEKES